VGTGKVKIYDWVGIETKSFFQRIERLSILAALQQNSTLFREAESGRAPRRNVPRYTG
jgi:hypothetical protein